MKDVLPEFQTRDEVLNENMTVTDCLSHRSGMETGEYWYRSDNQGLVPAEKRMDFINDLGRVHAFRARYLSTTWHTS